jgi:hypothetical protein
LGPGRLDRLAARLRCPFSLDANFSQGRLQDKSGLAIAIKAAG